MNMPAIIGISAGVVDQNGNLLGVRGAGESLIAERIVGLAGLSPGDFRIVDLSQMHIVLYSRQLLGGNHQAGASLLASPDALVDLGLRVDEVFCEKHLGDTSADVEQSLIDILADEALRFGASGGKLVVVTGIRSEYTADRIRNLSDMSLMVHAHRQVMADDFSLLERPDQWPVEMMPDNGYVAPQREFVPLVSECVLGLEEQESLVPIEVASGDLIGQVRGDDFDCPSIYAPDSRGVFGITDSLWPEKPARPKIAPRQQWCSLPVSPERYTVLCAAFPDYGDAIVVDDLGQASVITETLNLYSQRHLLHSPANVTAILAMAAEIPRNNPGVTLKARLYRDAAEVKAKISPDYGVEYD